MSVFSANAACGDPPVPALARIALMSASLVAAAAGWLALGASSRAADRRKPAARAPSEEQA